MDQLVSGISENGSTADGPTGSPSAKCKSSLIGAAKRNPVLQNAEKYEPTRAKILERFPIHVLSVTSQNSCCKKLCFLYEKFHYSNGIKIFPRSQKNP